MTGAPLFAGVDGGGSKTLVVVVDIEGRERGRGAAGSSNHAAVGLDAAVAAIRTAVHAATEAAGDGPTLGAAWIGLAGVDRPHDQAVLLPWLRPLAGEVRLTNDAELVLTALPGAVGVAVIAGTGAIALGRDAAGATTRASGWGHVIGDEGSGYELGRLALQAASRAADGRGPATALLRSIGAHWDLADPSEMIERVYHGVDKAGIAQLAELVFAAADEGDPVARKLVDRAAGELALAAVVVGDALGFGETALPLALAGGLLVGETGLRQKVLRRLRRRRTVGLVAVVDDAALSAARAAIALGRPDGEGSG